MPTFNWPGATVTISQECWWTLMPPERRKLMARIADQLSKVEALRQFPEALTVFRRLSREMRDAYNFQILPRERQQAKGSWFLLSQLSSQRDQFFNNLLKVEQVWGRVVPGYQFDAHPQTRPRQYSEVLTEFQAAAREVRRLLNILEYRNSFRTEETHLTATILWLVASAPKQSAV